MTVILYSQVENADRMVKPFERNEYLQENLLRDILHVFPAPQDYAHQREDALLVTPDQLLKGGLCPVLGQSHEFSLLFAFLTAVRGIETAEALAAMFFGTSGHGNQVTSKMSSLLQPNSGQHCGTIQLSACKNQMLHVTIPAMIIGDRIRLLRETKKLSQGDIEKRTGLLRCYISRVENGHTVPAIETLEKLARAMEVPLYQFSTTEKNRPSCRIFRSGKPRTTLPGAAKGKEARCWAAFADCWVALKKATADCCCTWLRKWPTAKHLSVELLRTSGPHGVYSHSIVLGGFELMS